MGFHIVKRENCPLWKKCGLYLGAVVLALALGAALLLALGGLSFAGAEDDWREQLRKLYGLTDDVQTDQKSESLDTRMIESTSSL